MSSRTFLLESTRFDVRKAEDYGPLVVLFPSDGMRSSVWEDHFVDDLFARLDRVAFDPSEDYLILAGDQVMVYTALAEMVARYARCHGGLQCLVWDARTKSYVPKRLGTSREHHFPAAL